MSFTTDEKVFTRKALTNGRAVLLCLPASWVRKQHIRAGDELVVIADGEVRVIPVKRRQNEKI